MSMVFTPAYLFGVKLMFVGVANFGHVPMLRLVGVKIFRSKSNQNLVILIRSCELALVEFLPQICSMQTQHEPDRFCRGKVASNLVKCIPGKCLRRREAQP